MTSEHGTEERGGSSVQRMVRCASCKHWGTEPGVRGNPRLRSCDHPKHVIGYQSADSVPDDGMIIEDDEGWGMEVGPLFGCVNGEASTPNELGEAPLGAQSTNNNQY